MRLTDILTPERIKIPLEAGAKEGLLRELSGLVAAERDGGESADIYEAVRARERVLSTGIGNGVALPHGKTAAITELRMAGGRTERPIDFGALDGRPVRLFFLLVGPDADTGPHIKALSRISRLVRDDRVRERFLAAADAAAFYSVLREVEAG